MYQIYKEFGEIDDVVTPPKWDKRGRRFGFLSFLNIKDNR